METIIEQIDAEIVRLQQAKTLLVRNDVKRGPGRPKAKADDLVSKILAVVPVRRVMSAEGKARIAAAQKIRWAKAKRAAKKAKSA
ncbi:hypothetical protein [Granulicella sp. dw_53]|uniref:hypothetical protein n=1 Tax=Granulicella sp. dw_53 TaxID=2719792 RepID=UPI00210616C8|nr:hypothetical protein [Granulicella sp. dw_53]